MKKIQINQTLRERVAIYPAIYFILGNNSKLFSIFYFRFSAIDSFNNINIYPKLY